MKTRHIAQCTNPKCKNSFYTSLNITRIKCSQCTKYFDQWIVNSTKYEESKNN